MKTSFHDKTGRPGTKATRIARLILACAFVAMLFAPASFADEETDTQNPETQTSETQTPQTGRPLAQDIIAEFIPLDVDVFYYEGEPTEKQLVAGLPEKLEVKIKGREEPVSVPVTWEVVEDFNKSSFYFYCIRPKWGDDFALNDDLDPNNDVPWVTVFYEPTKEEVKEGEKKLDIPVEDADDLKPIYTEEKGTINQKLSSAVPTLSGRPGSLAGTPEGSLQSLFPADPVYAASSSNAAKIYKYLTKTLGLNMAAACGVMTNLYAESGMQPNNLENTYNSRYGLSDSEYTKRVNKGIAAYGVSGGGKYKDGSGNTRKFTSDYSGYGICQWTTSGRRTGLLKKAVKKDVSIANLNMQLAYLKDELKNSYPQVWATLKSAPNNATGAYLSAAHFCNSFEIPANTVNTAGYRGRTALSTYWKTYSGKAGKTSGVSHLGICGYTYPKHVRKGIGMTCSGHVISNYTVKSVTARIKNAKGKTVYSSTKKPGTTIYSLYNFDNKMLFAKLSAGTYTYIIKAKDSFGKTVKVTHKFKVTDSGSTQYTRGCAAKNKSSDATEESAE